MHLELHRSPAIVTASSERHVRRPTHSHTLHHNLGANLGYSLRISLRVAESSKWSIRGRFRALPLHGVRDIYLCKKYLHITLVLAYLTNLTTWNSLELL